MTCKGSSAGVGRASCDLSKADPPCCRPQQECKRWGGSPRAAGPTPWHKRAVLVLGASLPHSPSAAPHSSLWDQSRFLTGVRGPLASYPTSVALSSSSAGDTCARVWLAANLPKRLPGPRWESGAHWAEQPHPHSPVRWAP